MDNAAFVGSSTTSYGAQSTWIGQDVNDYHYELDHLNTEFTQGVITFEDMTSAIQKLNDFVGPDFITFANDLDAQRARAAEAAQAVMEAAEAQIGSVFSQISSSVAQLNQAAAAANDPIAQVSNGIARLKNEAELLSDGARYAAGSAANKDTIDKANLISTAAGLAAQVLTTQDAADAAKRLAGTTAFAGVTGPALRDASLLLDGLKAFDPDSFVHAFDRINDALIRGGGDAGSVQSPGWRGDGVFQGLSDGAAVTAKGLRALADQLKPDDDLSALTLDQKTFRGAVAIRGR